MNLVKKKFACLKHSPIRFGARGKWKQVKRGNGRLNPPSVHYHSYYQWCRNQERKMKSSTLWQLPSIAPLAHLALSMVGSWWNWLLGVCEGGKQRRQFHHVCDNVQVCVWTKDSRGTVAHRCQAGEEMLRRHRALSSVMLKEREEKGRREMDCWLEHIVKRWKLPWPILDSLRIVFNQHKEKACSDE